MPVGSPRPSDVNYDESQVAPYVLPDPLVCFDGTPVHDPETWFEKRRPELLEFFEREIYGACPEPCEPELEASKVNERALGGLATRVESRVRIRGPEPRSLELEFRLLLWLPNAAQAPVPAFLGLNFFGNQTVHPDPEIELPAGWVPNNEALGITEHVATEASRGMQASRWPIETVLARGYAVATLYAGDIAPDDADGFDRGIYPLFYRPDQARPLAHEWGAVSAWAYGLSRALDVLEGEARIDARRVAVIGHSRFGKAALWAAAKDQRFALAISNESGCLGAALSRRNFGESIPNIVDRFPHWFCENLRRDPTRPRPVDQHQLLALIAPRPVYVASAALDLWADPRGEFLACRAADPVFRLLGTDGFSPVSDPPPLGQSLGSTLGYHVRPGAHDITPVDWWHYLAFADEHLSTTGSS